MKNPLVAKPSADPWVIRTGGSYYYTFSKDGSVWITRSLKLEDIGKEKPCQVWRPPENTCYSEDIWAPELHFVMGAWYIYVACDAGHNESHRMYVLEGGKDAENPLASAFAFKGKIADVHDKWAIDGTVMQYRDAYYFVWSGWEGDVDTGQNLYIAEMNSPYSFRGERVLLAVPEHPWEKEGLSLMEGPVSLEHDGKLFIIYSGSASWTRHYCLGMLSFIGDDPLNPKHWVKCPDPVFKSSERNNSYGVGHCSFVKSPEGTEDWIVYHGMSDGDGFHNRDVRAQPFSWDSRGRPVFGEPVAIDP